VQISKYLFNLSSFYHFRITVGYSAIPDVDGMTGQTLLEEWVVLGVRATLDSEGVVVPSSTYQWCSCQVSKLCRFSVALLVRDSMNYQT
jgi:hypothetical protein